MTQSRPEATKPVPIAAVFGKEAFLVRQGVKDLVTELLGPDPDHTALTEMDGGSAELSEVLDELRTLPFFGDRRVVVLSSADEFITRHRDALERYAEQPSPTGTLILACKSLPANTRLHKRIAKVGRIVRCDPPRGAAITQWITRRSRERYECRIDAGAAARLRELVGDDLGVLDNELGKLSIYVGDERRIGSRHVNELVAVHREETVFGIVEAMLTGDAARAVTLWNQVWSTDKAAPYRAIGGLAYAVRRVVSAKAALEAGAPVQEVARQLWTDPQGLHAQVSSHTLGELESLPARLRDADAAAKTGRGSVRDAVERLIVRTACRTHGNVWGQSA